MKPLAVDLFTGRGGFAAALVDAGFRVVGIDVEPKSPDFPEGAEYPLAEACA